MARAMGSSEAERAVRGEGAPMRSFGGAFPLPMFVVVGAGGGVAAGGGGELVPKESFTVRVKDGRQWIAARRLEEKLKDFVVEVQRNARLLKLINEDERIERLQLLGTNSSEPQELDVDATLGDVRICMGVSKVLLAVVAKLPPAATIPSRIPSSTPPGIRPETENRDHASANATSGIVERRASEDGTSKQSVRVRESHRKGQPSSPSANAMNSPAVVPSRGGRVDSLHSGDEQPERSVTIKRRFDEDIRVTESDLRSNPHMTLIQKAESLGISLTALKNARIELELGGWEGRQERARLRRLEGTSVDNGNSGAIAESSPKRARAEGTAVVGSCKQELL